MGESPAIRLSAAILVLSVVLRLLQGLREGKKH